MKRTTKLIHEGNYVVEVDVELLEGEDGWSPYISLNDAKKLDEIRQALQTDDLARASRLGRLFQLTPIEA